MWIIPPGEAEIDENDEIIMINVEDFPSRLNAPDAFVVAILNPDDFDRFGLDIVTGALAPLTIQ